MPLMTSLKALLARLMLAEIVPRPASEPWHALIARISVPGRITEIDQETYTYFLEVLPPKYQGGGLFAFAEGAEPFRLFWVSGTRCFCRALTWDETQEFCRTALVPFPR